MYSRLQCNDSVTSRRPHNIRSVEQSQFRRAPVRPFRYSLERRKNELREKEILSIRGNVVREVELLLLSFRLKDLTLRFGKQENKRGS